MPYDASLEAERMIRAAGRCPQLTSGLRERIIAESVRTRSTVERRLRLIRDTWEEAIDE